jgi:hypothetical protein
MQYSKPAADELDDVSGRAGEEIRLGQREIYVYYPSGMGQSKLQIPAARLGTSSAEGIGGEYRRPRVDMGRQAQRLVSLLRRVPSHQAAYADNVDHICRRIREDDRIRRSPVLDRSPTPGSSKYPEIHVRIRAHELRPRRLS